MHSLAIIDMQYWFSASRKIFLKKPILREIDLCKRNNWPILIVEFTEYNGKTRRYIRDSLNEYSRKVRFYKYTMNGSEKIRSALKRMTRCKNIRLVGVNTDQCVGFTAINLQDSGFKVTIVADGCWTSGGWSVHEETISYLLNNYNMNVIRL